MKKSHFTSKLANRIVPSPDNKWVAIIHLHKVYIAPFIQNGQEINLDIKTKSFHVESLSEEAGIDIHWGSSNKKVHWILGDEYFTKNLIDNTKDPFAKTNLDSSKAAPIKINLEVKSDVPEGIIAFTNARLITMNGDKVIEEGTIIINQNKIDTIGTSEKIVIPEGAKVYDMKGKTIMPGIVDVHAHVGAFRNGLSTQKTLAILCKFSFWSYHLS